MRLAEAPVRDVRPLLAEERAALLDLVGGLAAGDWGLGTACPGWSVHDIAAHVLGEDLGLLARGRDGHRGATIPEHGDYRDFVAALNASNQLWVEAARRISPRQLRELLAGTGAELAAWWADADLAAPASVSWTGPDPVPAWFDLARHYTERWVHQQQIRDAVGRPGLADGRQLAAVLHTFVWCLPHAYRRAEAEPGTEVAVTITGPGGGDWALTRTATRWDLNEQPAARAAASVRLTSDHAWRLFSGGPEDQEAVLVEGPAELTIPFLAARAIIV